MYLTCSRCQITNPPDALFCKNCGYGFQVKPLRKKPIVAPIIIIVAVIALCGLCGIFGLISDSRKETAQSSNINARSLVGANLSEPKLSNSASEPPKTPGSERSATVISDNANLRKTAQKSSQVVQTLPKDATVEVVRQSGAWFYVRSGTQSGWMHGNTIRLNNGGSKPVPPVAETYSAPKPMRTPEPVINNSGATAECRDGSLSYSAHRRGTCSHHGGVAVWY